MLRSYHWNKYKHISFHGNYTRRVAWTDLYDQVSICLCSEIDGVLSADPFLQIVLASCNTSWNIQSVCSLWNMTFCFFDGVYEILPYHYKFLYTKKKNLLKIFTSSIVVCIYVLCVYRVEILSILSISPSFFWGLLHYHSFRVYKGYKHDNVILSGVQISFIHPKTMVMEEEIEMAKWRGSLVLMACSICSNRWCVLILIHIYNKQIHVSKLFLVWKDLIHCSGNVFLE